MVIFNRPGAGGNIGTGQVVKSQPDGTTIGYVTNGIMCVNPYLYDRQSFDPLKDLTPVAGLTSIGLVLAVSPKALPDVHTAADLVKHAQARPGETAFASAGPGTTSHLAGILLESEAKLDLNHIPHAGGAAAVKEVLAGRVPFLIDVMPNLLPHLKAGTLRALAVTTPSRSALLPKVPTMAEAGLPGVTLYAWDGIAKITINRPQVHNAFRPQTVMEMSRALNDARNDADVGVIILTGMGENAFCSGGDQKVRGTGGYVGDDGTPRLNVLDLQREIRTCPKPVVAMVAGWCVGGGHVLHMMCDLTIAAENAMFGQTGPRVGSFDGGWGASYMARIVGQKKAREIWFLCRFYNAKEALDMGLVNTVVPLEKLEAETVQWCREMLANSPLALRCLKAALNADCDGQAGLQELAGNATLLYYMTEEGREGKNAFLEKRRPDFSKFQRLP